MIQLNDTVQISPKDFDTMTGTVVRIVKFDKPFAEESSNPNDWTLHVQVESNHPRNSGLFQVGYNNATKVEA